MRLLQCDYQTKTPIFSVANDAFSFSQYCMKTWLTKKFALITASLERDWLLKNVTGIWINRIRMFTNRTNLTPDKSFGDCNGYAYVIQSTEI